ncbi:sensor histidine kinase [Sphingomonas sp.]|uniref:sensor histidine kinase n=1 Tax=Sphingomonas sp. TaxID=28214 RepID=UPI003CC51FBD
MSRAEPQRRGGRSIAWSILLLVVAAAAAATAVMFAVTFNGPPPMPAPQPYANIVTALRTGHGPSGNGRPLSVVERPIPPEPRFTDRRDPAAEVQLARLLGAPAADVLALMPPGHSDVPDEVRGPFQVGWRHDGAWRIVETRPDSFFTPWHRVTLTAMLLVLALLSGLAWFVARAISRPLRQVADAALAARAGTPLKPLPAGGAAEVRDLTRAVLTMHDRLQRHAEGRTAMLGAIAHDLGTPLSRLAFWIEQLPEAARARAAGDIDEMRAMIAATLVFARDEAAPAQAARVDLGSLLDSLVEDMAVAGAPVKLTAGDRAIVRGDPGALRRLFANLIANAVRYGDTAALSWQMVDDAVAVRVDDAGPGLGGADAERLFEPFVRGESSRNRATGGAGLGLAIVRTIATRHGGTVMLSDRVDGVGARAEVMLPIA